MPFGDGTGPAGMGPMTGRAAGYCAGYNVPGNTNPVGGRSRMYGAGGFFGRGRGRARGNRNWFYATGQPGWSRYDAGMPAWGQVRVTPPQAYPPVYNEEQELEFLKDHMDMLQSQMEEVQKRISEIGESSKKEPKK